MGDLQDIKQEMLEDMLKDQHHEMLMVSDNEYFIEYMIEQVNFKGTLVDIHSELSEWCLKYGNDVTVVDILEYLKEV